MAETKVNEFTPIPRECVDRVLVKYSFTNRKLIPNGIPEKVRGEEKLYWERNATFAYLNGLADKAEVGRLRKQASGLGIVDSGEPLFYDIKQCSGMINWGEPPNGMISVPVDRHWFQKESNREGGTPKFVVCTTWRWMTLESLAEFQSQFPNGMPDWFEASTAELEATTWKDLWGYLNPNGVVTLNFLGRAWDDKAQAYEPPKTRVVEHAGHLVITSV